MAGTQTTATEPSVLEWWAGLEPKWQKLLALNLAVCREGNDHDRRYMMNPDIDVPTTAFRATFGRPFAMPKKLAEPDIEAIAAMEQLACYASKLQSLSGIERLQGLRRLNARKNKDLVDIQAIAGLTALEEVSLLQTAVTNIEPLAGLERLDTLYLFKTKICDLRPLVGLARLRKLTISAPRCDFMPLLDCRSLKELVLGGRVPPAVIDALAQRRSDIAVTRY